MFRPFPAQSLPSGTDRARCGSILAETLLVLPLYLMLLGGLFVVGDLIVARFRSQALDRASAWIRPGGTIPSGTTLPGHFRSWEGLDAGGGRGWFGVKLGDPENSSVFPMHSWGVKPEENSTVGSDSGIGVPTQGNRWVGFYQGVSFVSVGVPFWVPLLDVADSVRSRPDGEEPERTESLYRIDAEHPGWDGGDPVFGRSFVFTRRNASLEDPPPDRSNTPDADDPSPDKVLKKQAILQDLWPCIPDRTEVPVFPAMPHYERGVMSIVLGEQKSGL